MGDFAQGLGLVTLGFVPFVIAERVIKIFRRRAALDHQAIDFSPVLQIATRNGALIMIGVDPHALHRLVERHAG